MKRYLLYISIISLGSLLFTQPVTPKVAADVTSPVVTQKPKSRPTESVAKVTPTPTPEATPSPTPVATPQTAPKPAQQPVYVAPQPAISGDHATLAAEAGISATDFIYVDFIVMHEGHYNPCVINGGDVDCSYALNGGQRAYGACQSLPGTKMASAGADWATNVVTQLKWCNSYALGRYGSWAAAYNFWISHRYW